MNYRTISLATASALAFLASGGTAAAQDAAPAGGGASAEAAEIIVTGSRIGRKDYVAQSPIVTATTDAIQKAGSSTVDNYLRQLPQFRPGSGEFTNNSAGGTIGQSNLNLRGLGAQRNLVLMDGRRLQPSDINGAIDINTIPSLAIGNIEIISGGASATYGSDAMSGVVNFRLRTDLKGLEISAQNSLTTQGDGAVRQIGGAWGTRFADGRGKLLLSAEYIDRSGIAVRDRDFFVNTTASGFMPQGNVNSDGNNLPSQTAVNTIFARYGITTGVPLRSSSFFVNTDGSLFFRGTNATNTLNYRGPTGLPYISNSSFFGYHGSYYNYLRAPLKRSNVFARAEYDLGGDTSVYAQVNFSHAKAKNIGSEAILGAGFVESIPVTNPFISADLRDLLASRTTPGAEFQYVDRVEQVGPRVYQTSTTLWQSVVGAKGRLGGLGLNWDIYWSHGDTRNKDATISGAVSVAAINRLTHAADGGASLCSGGYNPFGLQPLSSACIAYISRTPINRTNIAQDVIEGSVDGALFPLPGGDAKFALTGGWRSNRYSFAPDASIAAGDIATIASSQSTRGTITVTEAAGELLLPLLADVPLVKAFNVTLGYRFSHYNLSGDAHTWKADFDWRVARPLMIRGGYQRALRAPNIGEFFQSPTQVIVGIGNPPGSGDPCDTGSSFRANNNPNATQVRTLCIATGLPSSIVDGYKITTASIITNFQGNQALQPETAKTWTVGAVLTSPFDASALRNMSLSVDYYNIRIANAIATLDPLTVLQKCFNADGSNPTYDVNNTFCKYVTRPTGNDPFVFRPTLNLGGYRTSGVDVQFDWRIPIAAIGGGLNLSSYVNYLKTFAVQTLPGAAFQENAGTLGGGGSYPKWTHVESASLDIGRLQLTTRWRHIASMRDSSTITNRQSRTPGVRPYDYVDLSGRLTVNDRFELRAGITNVADRAPPVVAGTPGSTNLGVYDGIGRTWFVGLKARI